MNGCGEDRARNRGRSPSKRMPQDRRPCPWCRMPQRTRHRRFRARQSRLRRRTRRSSTTQVSQIALFDQADGYGGSGRRYPAQDGGIPPVVEASDPVGKNDEKQRNGDVGYRRAKVAVSKDENVDGGKRKARIVEKVDAPSEYQCEPDDLLQRKGSAGHEPLSGTAFRTLFSLCRPLRIPFFHGNPPRMVAGSSKSQAKDRFGSYRALVRVRNYSKQAARCP